MESAIAQGQRDMLLAMATGTGKTKTCIALIYRLLKAQRFRRMLFLVDRSALGEQAANAFKDTRMENLQTFADIFGIKELDGPQPDTDTAVHIATVQGMVQRVLSAGEDNPPPPVDQYDCIVVDECHRGYLLDRELSDTELGFRGYEDYISKYRRVLDYFDAVKIGLTATPALHTTEIFGPPIYIYSYREAVIDGYLVDHEPPVQIHTELSTTGIRWKVGEEVKVYDARANSRSTSSPPRTRSKFEVDAFNRKVITEPFNRVVCDYLAGELDPASPPEDPDLLRHRRPCRPGGGPAQAGLPRALRQRGRRRRHQDHRRRRPAAAADPPLQERAQPQCGGHGGPAHHRHRRPRDLQPGLPAPGQQPHPVRPDARARHPPVRRDRQGALPHLRRRAHLRGPGGSDRHAPGGGRPQHRLHPARRAS